MRKTTFIACTLFAIGCVLYACNSAASREDKKKEPIPTQSEMIARGEYLVAAIGCDDCHSPKIMGPKGPELIQELRLSGYPASRPTQQPDTGALRRGWMLMGADLTSAVGPWGISYAANITSDETGIGSWKESNFITAMRTGKLKGLENGRPMLPPMPWFNFAKLTDEDLKAVFAYLKSTKPVQNIAPPPMPPSPVR